MRENKKECEEKLTLPHTFSGERFEIIFIAANTNTKGFKYLLQNYTNRKLSWCYYKKNPIDSAYNNWEKHNPIIDIIFFKYKRTK